MERHIFSSRAAGTCMKCGATYSPNHTVGLCKACRSKVCKKCGKKFSLVLSSKSERLCSLCYDYHFKKAELISEDCIY